MNVVTLGLRSRGWILSSFFVIGPVSNLVATPKLAHSPVRMPLTFEPQSGGVLAAHQGPIEVSLAAGRITTTIVHAGTHHRAAVTTKLIGARSRVLPEGADLLAARANYLLGSNPARWRTGVPLYARAIYRNVYPHIDLVFHGNGSALEYDFVVQPGADASRIALEISGASAVRSMPDGALEITTAAGAIRWRKPAVYQIIDGVRHDIPGRFLHRGRRVLFALGPYDHRQTLTIDPTLAYASYFGGSDDEASRGIAVDSAGNMYITGFTLSNNLPVTAGAFQTAFHGGMGEIAGDVFVAKFTASGTFSYVTYIGGSQEDIGSAIAVDANGNAYVTGYTDSTDFPTVAGAFQTQFQGSGGSKWYGPMGDAFVLKLNPAGSSLIYSTYLGGSLDDRGTAIAVDSAGNAYVGGMTVSTNFPVLNAYQSTYKGGGGSPAFCCGDPSPFMTMGDGFITKLNPGGTGLVFSTYFGGSLDDTVSALAIDSIGDVYFAGSTLSTDFPILSAYQSHFGGAASPDVQPIITVGDGYVAKLNPAGGLLYSTYLGGSSDDGVMALAIDATGAAYVTGFTSSANFPVSSNAAQHNFTGPSTLTGLRGFLWGDAFAAKLSPNGQSLVYSTFIGGSADDSGAAIAVDGAGNAYIAGGANSTNFPVTKTALQPTFGGAGAVAGDIATDPFGDGFLTQLSPDGSTFLYSSYYGGEYDDAFSSIALDAQGTLYLSGSTVSPNLSVTSNAAQPTFNGGESGEENFGDGFVAKFTGLAVISGPSIGSVVNGASDVPGIAPNSWITIFGTNLASATAPWTVTNGQLPTSVGGVTVNVGGQPGYISYVSPIQVNVVAPNIGTGPTQVTVTNSIGTSTAFATTSAAYSPGFFQWPGGFAVATHTDFSPAVKNGTFPGLTTVPAKPGEIIILWGTGFGPTAPAAPVGEVTPSDAIYATPNPAVTIGGMEATVSTCVLAPGFAALYQLAVQVPTTLANGDYPVVATIGGVSSPSTQLLTVQQ